MRILLVTQYYPPEPIGKFAELAEALVDRGHTVEVITGTPCYPKGKIYDGHSRSISRAETRPGLVVSRVPQWPDHSRSTWRRIAYYLSFALASCTLGLIRAGRADVVVAYQAAMPVGFAAWWIARFKRAPLVLDVVDLWPESIEAVGMIKNRRALALIRGAMNWLYRRAAHINVITKGYRENLIQQGVAESKLGLIYQWPHAQFSNQVQRDPEFTEAAAMKPGLNVVYAGAVGTCQDLDVVLDAAESLGDDSPRWWIVGDGTEQRRLAREADRRGLRQVRFVGSVAPEVAAQWLKHADLQLIHLEPSPMARLSIPSKTLACLAIGQPLLMGVEGEASDLVLEHRCGLTFDPGESLSLVRAIRAFANQSPDQQARMGQRARDAFEQNFDSDRLMSRYSAMLESVASAPTSHRTRVANLRKAA